MDSLLKERSKQMGEEVFKLLGVFALKGKDEVDKGIDDTVEHAEKGS